MCCLCVGLAWGLPEQRVQLEHDPRVLEPPAHKRRQAQHRAQVSSVKHLHSQQSTKLGRGCDSKRHPWPSPGDAQQDQSQGGPVEGRGSEARDLELHEPAQAKVTGLSQGLSGRFTGECLCVTLK